MWIKCSDSMPERGQTVLAYFINPLGKGRTVRAEYFSHKQVEVGDDDLLDDLDDWGVWDEEEQAYFYPAGWHEIPVEAEQCFRLHGVSHWMPLPDPPSD